MDSNHKISLLDIGLVIEKLIGHGYVSEYSKKDFKTRYQNFIFKMVGFSKKRGVQINNLKI